VSSDSVESQKQNNTIYFYLFFPFEKAGFDSSVDPKVIERLHEAAMRMLPALGSDAGAKIVKSWSGLRPDTRGGREQVHMPITGPVPSVPNLYLCTGHYKTGIGYGPWVSNEMSKMLHRDGQGDDSSTTTSPLIPFYPGSSSTVTQ